MLELKKMECPPFVFASINLNKKSGGYFLEQENDAKIIQKIEKTHDLMIFAHQDIN